MSSLHKFFSKKERYIAISSIHSLLLQKSEKNPNYSPNLNLNLLIPLLVVLVILLPFHCFFFFFFLFIFRPILCKMSDSIGDSKKQQQQHNLSTSPPEDPNQEPPPPDHHSPVVVATGAVNNPKRPKYTTTTTSQWKTISTSSPSQIPPHHNVMAAASSSDTATSSPSPSPRPSEGGGQQFHHHPHQQFRKGKYVSPVWKPNEMLWLAKAWRIQYQGGGEGATSAAAREKKTRADKDKEVAEFLNVNGVNRDAKIAGTKWDNMLGEFRKVYEWEKCGEKEHLGKSYFRLSPFERKLHRLPASFDEEVFEELSQFMGSRIRTSLNVRGGDDSANKSLPPPFREDDPPTFSSKHMPLIFSFSFYTWEQKYELNTKSRFVV